MDDTKLYGDGGTSHTPNYPNNTMRLSGTEATANGTIYEITGSQQPLSFRHPIINSKKKRRAKQSKMMKSRNGE